MSFFGSINTAVEALNAFSTQIGNISDNVANSSTTGYKTVDTRFSDMVATKLQGASPVLDSPVQGGVRSSAYFANRSQGQIIPDSTGSSAAISGNGFFPVAKATGLDTVTGEPTGFDSTAYYTRQGDFHLDNSGHLVNSAGYYLMTGTAGGSGPPQLLTLNTSNPALAAGVTDVSITDGGAVVANLSDHTSVKIGQILLANFPEPDALDRVNGGAFIETASSGAVAAMSTTRAMAGRSRDGWSSTAITAADATTVTAIAIATIATSAGTTATAAALPAGSSGAA